MVTERQKRKIMKLMKRIKEAKNSPHLTKNDIIKRTQDLYRYLEDEGIVISDMND